MEEASFMEADRRAVVVGMALAKGSAPADSSEMTPHDRAVFYGVMDMVSELLRRN